MKLSISELCLGNLEIQVPLQNCLFWPWPLSLHCTTYFWIKSWHGTYEVYARSSLSFAWEINLSQLPVLTHGNWDEFRFSLALTTRNPLKRNRNNLSKILDARPPINKLKQKHYLIILKHRIHFFPQFFPAELGTFFLCAASAQTHTPVGRKVSHRIPVCTRLP